MDPVKSSAGGIRLVYGLVSSVTPRGDTLQLAVGRASCCGVGWRASRPARLPGNRTLDAATVMANMKKLPINDFFAKNGSIRDDGRMVHDMYLVQVKKPADSKYAWDYYSVKATIPAADAFQPLSQSRCPLVKK